MFRTYCYIYKHRWWPRAGPGAGVCGGVPEGAEADVRGRTAGGGQAGEPMLHDFACGMPSRASTCCVRVKFDCRWHLRMRGECTQGGASCTLSSGNRISDGFGEIVSCGSFSICPFIKVRVYHVIEYCKGYGDCQRSDSFHACGLEQQCGTTGAGVCCEALSAATVRVPRVRGLVQGAAAGCRGGGGPQQARTCATQAAGRQRQEGQHPVLPAACCLLVERQERLLEHGRSYASASVSYQRCVVQCITWQF